MLNITCPFCGPRAEIEFSYGGQAHIARPKNSDRISDEAWAEFLFYETNPKGLYRERWMHASGCRKWFNMMRDTVSHEIFGTYKVGEKPSMSELRGKGQSK